ncbi:LAETG motif-containing sortase-dependent surface protein [Streptomyces thermoalcalitolerans]|uniref:Gram-positive cocci surface proteins LPxTG domain-containing protein n=1 Tax=Streptomyces thermoalcalitolerans TaxID=65605 RepID=A0ABP3ZV10_9ACTN
MKLRRAMAAAAATAVIAPLALLSAPAAFAEETAPSSSVSTETTSPEKGSEETESPEEGTEETKSPEEGPKETEETKSPEDGTEETKSPEEGPKETESPEPGPTSSAPEETESPEPEPTSSAPEETESPDEEEPPLCEDTKVDVSIKGLPGKIAAGSGWHKFTLNVANNSDSTLTDLDYFAGASSDKEGEDLFKSKQVQLQAWNPEDKVWEDLDSDGYAVGYVGYTDVLEPDYEVDIPLRVNVKANAPVGAGFTLGATIYGDGDGECVGVGGVSYKFLIVGAGTNTDGTKPQVGGKAPIADTKPDGTTPKLEGKLAETGSSSALPMIGLIGGAAVAAGAGAIVVVRRRKAGAVA